MQNISFNVFYLVKDTRISTHFKHLVSLFIHGGLKFDQNLFITFIIIKQFSTKKHTKSHNLPFVKSDNSLNVNGVLTGEHGKSPALGAFLVKLRERKCLYCI